MNAKPVGGINLLVSLMIIGGYNVKKKYNSFKMKKTVLSVFIIGFILIYLISSLLSGFGLDFSLKDDSCELVYNKVGERNIIIRIDDIQAFSYNELQVKMLDELVNRGFTVSLGVIPLGLSEDKKIFDYLIKHKCEFEIALHGYDNSDYEFDGLTYLEAEEKLDLALEILNQLEPNIVTFIPPNNRLSNESEQAVWDKGIEVISAGFWNSEHGFSISTFDWNTHELENVNYVLEECKKDMDNNETCIIMIHPQDYVNEDGEVDEEKYKNYLGLLDGINNLNANVINFRDLYHKDTIKLN